MLGIHKYFKIDFQIFAFQGFWDKERICIRVT